MIWYQIVSKLFLVTLYIAFLFIVPSLKEVKKEILGILISVSRRVFTR